LIDRLVGSRIIQCVIDTVHNTEKALIVLADKDDTVERAAANIPNVKTTQVGTLSAYEILKYEKLILTKASAEKIEEVYA
ncbi:MAG: 50S ribosomal protein L4, partial [Clostridia bacterium]|nr:50S ribosomal protein L4 [Clostridia bacterium]